jgi:hypothetical protein
MAQGKMSGIKVAGDTGDDRERDEPAIGLEITEKATEAGGEHRLEDKQSCKAHSVGQGRTALSLPG